ncbi:MAG: phage holin family protein [Chloroherpetonaceae bacterium]|nr:phage holin family protein [Chloroherpetonaceae bacterium]MDW8437901.1 phage holin family protein [Chloroherpetonaceae bacterium]
MTRLLIAWLINAVAVYFAATFIDGISVKGLGATLLAALVIGLLNAIVKPVLILFSIPFIALTLGLFLLVINAALLMLAAYLVPDFRVESFWAAVLGSIVISVVSWLLGMILQPKD